MPKEINSPQELMDLVNGFRISRIILTSHELKIYSHLSGKEKTSPEVASELRTDLRATDRFLNALVACGLLRKADGKFSNTDFSERFLVTGKPAYLGGLTHSAGLWRTWNTLTEAIYAGKTVFITEPIADREENWLEGFIAAMHTRGVRQAVEVADVLDLSHVAKILDVGGGSGAFSYEFIRRIPAAKAVIFDLPAVIPITRKYMAAAKMEGSVTTLEGDYLVNDFKGKYDLVYLSAVIHINSPEENLWLIKKSAGVLNPGGQLVIMDHIMNRDRTEPQAGAIFALNMLVGTEHGDTYTEEEIRSWMKDAGLAEIRRVETAGGTNLMCGAKGK